MPSSDSLVHSCLLALLVACQTSPGAEGGSPDVVADDTATTAPGTPAPADLRTIYLVSFECGDNCYILYKDNPDDPETQTALCEAPECGEWVSAGSLPPSAQRQVQARFSTSDRIDGSNTVVDTDYPAIVAFVGLPSTGSSSTGSPSGKALPLTVGFYVREGVDCERPSNADMRFFDGAGLSGSATRDCRLTVGERDGPRYRMTQDCVDTYTSERSTTALDLTVLTERSFRLDGDNTGTFRLCDLADAPAGMRPK